MPASLMVPHTSSGGDSGKIWPLLLWKFTNSYPLFLLLVESAPHILWGGAVTCWMTTNPIGPNTNRSRKGSTTNCNQAKYDLVEHRRHRERQKPQPLFL